MHDLSAIVNLGHPRRNISKCVEIQRRLFRVERRNLQSLSDRNIQDEDVRNLLALSSKFEYIDYWNHYPF